MRGLYRVAALALTVAGLGLAPVMSAQPVAAQAPTTWPPVISELGQVTVGNLTALFIVVSNRTSSQHAFVDVRGYAPAAVRIVDSFAGVPASNPGKVEGLAPDGQQVGWVNHFVRAGQAQGPFVYVVDNAGRTFEAWTWMWFQTGAGLGNIPGQNGNFSSARIRTDSPASTTPGLSGVVPGAQ